MKASCNIKINDKGIALVFVLWILVILGVIAGQFCYSMRNELKAAGMIRDESQAYYLARAGILSTLNKMTQNEIGDAPREKDQKKVWRVAADIPPQSVGDGSYKISIGNESGKVNLNYADRDLLKMFFSSLDVEEKDCEIIVDSILDWRDRDSLYRLNGAENDYYRSLSEPYKCRDGFFRYVDEILLVRGVTKEMYDKGLKDFITVVIIPDVALEGERQINKGLININAAPERLLRILPGMTSEALENIISFRQKKDISGLHELIKITNPETADGLKKFIDYRHNRFYTFDADGLTGNNETRQRIRVMVQEMPATKKRYEIIQWIDNAAEY